MFKALLVATASLLACGFAFAQSSSLDRAQVKVKPASKAEALAISNGAAATGAWCDSFGFVWELGSAGRSGRTINVTGAATNMCGSSPAAGTLTLARGLPLDVTASVNPGCYCNAFHQMVLTFSGGVFTGTAYAFGGCEAEGPVTLGKC